MVNGRRGGCLPKVVIGIVVLAVLAVGADFLARNVAQDKLASEIQQHGFPKKPSVTIEGFPFLTQVASRDIDQVRLNSTDIPEGPVRISRVSAVLSGIHLNSGYTSGTVSRLSGSVLITFGSLAKTLNSRIGPFGTLLSATGMTLSSAGPNEVKASLDLLVTSGSATWRISRLSGRELQARLVSSSGISSSMLNSISEFRIRIPKLPFDVRIGAVRIKPAGVVGRISGSDLTFSG
jgi:hypothetical protein